MNRGQGTIEYLVILGVIILIGLVVVGLSTNFLEQTEQINTSTSRVDSSIGITGISITENVLDSSGNGAVTLQNTSNDQITLTKITVDGVDNNYSRIILRGDNATLLLNNLSCTCSAGETSKTCTYTFYFIQNGVATIKTKTLTANCSGNFGGGGGAVPPTITDDTGPVITLSSPADGYQQTSTGTTTFSFSVSDASTVSSCSLALNLTDVNSITTPSADVTLNYEFTEDLNYDWTVTCIDSEANSTTTSSREISIDNNNYELNNCQQVYNMRNGLSSTYKLMNDVDCANFDPEGMASEFYSIGESATPFTGTLDGNGNVISNVTVDSDNSEIGLFGYTTGATIYDLGLENVYMRGSINVGGLIGQAVASTNVQRVYVTGTTTSNSGYEVGGVVGLFSASTMRDVYAEVNVTGYSSVGGVAGKIYDSSTLERTYSRGTVNNPNNAWYIGGLIGGSHTSSKDTNSYSIANLTNAGQATNTGGVEGYSIGSTRTNLYWDTTLTGQATCYPGGITNCTSTTNQDSSYHGASGIPFTNLGFQTNVWQSRDNNHPIFVWQ